MPSSATITTFYSFVANTKARASQVNLNFDTWRGHVVPVDPNTATAINNTYDLGSSEYYWRVGYYGSIDFRTSTSTATLILKGDTSNTTGAFLFQIEGVTKSKIDNTGFDGNYIKAESVTIGSFFSRGTAYGTAGSNGTIGTSNTFTVSNISRTAATSSTYHVAGSTVTVTGIGRPMYLGVISDGFTIVGDTFTSQTPLSGSIALMKDGVAVYTGTYSYGFWAVTTGVTSISLSARSYTAPLNLWTVLMGVSSGANHYSLAIILDHTNNVYGIANARVIAHEVA